MFEIVVNESQAIWPEPAASPQDGVSRVIAAVVEEKVGSFTLSRRQGENPQGLVCDLWGVRSGRSW